MSNQMIFATLALNVLGNLIFYMLKEYSKKGKLL
jgi:hypothetical protein